MISALRGVMPPDRYVSRTTYRGEQSYYASSRNFSKMQVQYVELFLYEELLKYQTVGCAGVVRSGRESTLRSEDVNLRWQCGIME